MREKNKSHIYDSNINDDKIVKWKILIHSKYLNHNRRKVGCAIETKNKKLRIKILYLKHQRELIGSDISGIS